MIKLAQKALPGILLILLVAAVLPHVTGCRSSRESEREEREREGERDRGEVYEDEDEEFEHARPLPPMAWGGGMRVEPAEGHADTLLFHIGSPFFITMRIGEDRACEPFNGTPFYFDAGGAQLGWGFEEVADSILFPHPAGSCNRTLMLSSENSNRIAEGYYSFKTLIFLDATSRLYSDTLVVHAVRSHNGADTLSYARFLEEQVVRNSPMLSDPETLRALFAEGTPRSAESEIYRAVILYKIGEAAGADAAISSSQRLEAQRGKPVAGTAAAARSLLIERLRALR
jgi:hypothetical protein